MDVEITQDAIEKLTHNSEEIRLRALEQIESKFTRALGHQLRISFNPTELCKQLIRWFKYQSPSKTNKKVLDLLARLLTSAYGEEAFQQLGVARLRTELNKVQNLLQEKPLEQQIIHKIHEILFEHDKSFNNHQSDSDLVSMVEALSITSDDSEAALPGCLPEDYEIAWSEPTVADYNSLKAMAELILRRTTTSEEKDKLLQYLQVTMPDYPAEYMLQSPHIFVKLLQLCGHCEADEKLLQANVFSTLITFSKILRQSLRKRHMIDSYAVQKFGTTSHALKQVGSKSKTQLKVGKAMELLLEKCLAQLEAHPVSLRKENMLVMYTVNEILEIIKIQHLCVASRFLARVDRIRAQLQDICNQDETHMTLARTKQIWLTFILLQMSEINAKRSQLVDQYKLLIPQLLDFSLHLYFPTLCERLKKLIFNADITIEQSYKQVQILKNRLELATQFLKHEIVETSEVITKGAHIIPILDRLKSSKLTKILFDALLKAIPLYLTEHKVKTQAISLLHKLMQLRSPGLKSYVYQSIAMAVKKHFAALMNNETICSGVQNQQLLSTLIIGVPFDLDVFQQIVHDSFESSCAELKKNAEDIILLLLKCHHFYETYWKTFLETFLPALPMLQCCTHSKPICDMLLKLLDPDSKLFPFIDFLRGNITFMFANDSSVRTEALIRLIYMLNSLPYSSDYVPNIIEISDVLPNDLCILQTPRDFQQIFIVNESYYELTTLRNLLMLLDTPDIEPQVRKSTLMQLNIMCKSWETVKAFCEEQAHCLILSALENSLKKTSTTEYIENIIPVVSILAKLLICDCTFRHELAGIPNVYVLLLRALFHFSQDVQLRQDTSICLFLLVFGNFLVTPRSGGDVVAPKLVSNLNVPLKCKFKSMEYPHHSFIPDIMQSFFISEAELKIFIRQVIAHSYFKALNFSKKEMEQMHSSLDICPSLLIKQRDLRLIRSTNSFQNMRAIMKSISNATDQKTFIKTANTLQLQLILHDLEYDKLIELPSEVANGIFSLLTKYLQGTPGNAADFQVYACALDILYLCVRLLSLPIIRQLKSMLRTDFHNGIIIMLKNSELPLDIYLRLVELLVALLKASTNEVHEADQTLYSNLFELFHDVTLQFFASRNLQRIRCLLSVLKTLTEFNLKLPEKILYKCGKSIIKLSINLKSPTQTGAQWHRDCLLSYIQIFKQLPAALEVSISESFLTYMVGLCGHKDMEVRALSWICLTQCANIKESRDTNCKSLGTNGIQLITTKLTDLPGGFIGCCLSTFLGAHESLLVRHFAGNLFILLLNETCDFETAILLLERNAFFATAYTSLETCIFDRILPLHSPYLKAQHEFSEDGTGIEVATCETVICYCRICIALITLKPGFIIELSEKSLLFKIYELIKLPLVPSNETHYEMCAQICHLYAMCSENYFIFLQQTVCHDDQWLSSLFDLLDPPLNASEKSIVCVLQLILSLCRDDFVFGRLCAKLTKNLDTLRKLLGRAINITRIGHPLQRCTLSLFIYLLTKAQHEGIVEEDKTNFIVALEKEYELPQKTPELLYRDSLSEANKENISWRASLRGQKQRHKSETDRVAYKFETNGKITLPQIVLIDLYKIFTHLYPCNSYKFDSSPGVTRIQICETLSLILKLSPPARLAAKNLKLLNKILLILESFFRKFGNSGTTFIKRHGETKKLAIIKNLNILFQILLYWFSPSAGILDDELQCLEVSKIIIKSWPWLEYSLELKSLVLQVCSFLSERSLPVCSQFSALISSYSHSILQLVTKVVVAETHKVKATGAIHFSIVSVGLRVMMNCCACTEGRFTLVKEHALYVIDGLHPFNMKSSKTRVELLHLWLQFWELFSRYSEGGQARNLNDLCAVINRSAPCSKTRLTCLKILRNMCFIQQNRAMLMVSTDFIYTANEVISQPMNTDSTDPVSYEEQLVVSVAIWQLISGGIKFMAMLRGTNLAGNLRNLREKLLVLNEEDCIQFAKLPFTVDLANILEIIFNIFAEN